MHHIVHACNELPIGTSLYGTNKWFMLYYEMIFIIYSIFRWNSYENRRTYFKNFGNLHCFKYHLYKRLFRLTENLQVLIRELLLYAFLLVCQMVFLFFCLFVVYYSMLEVTWVNNCIDDSLKIASQYVTVSMVVYFVLLPGQTNTPQLSL